MLLIARALIQRANELRSVDADLSAEVEGQYKDLLMQRATSHGNGADRVAHRDAHLLQAGRDLDARFSETPHRLVGRSTYLDLNSETTGDDDVTTAWFLRGVADALYGRDPMTEWDVEGCNVHAYRTGYTSIVAGHALCQEP